MAVVGAAPHRDHPVCIRTFKVSKGWPTHAAAAPERLPARKGSVHSGSCRLPALQLTTESNKTAAPEDLRPRRGALDEGLV